MKLHHIAVTAVVSILFGATAWADDESVATRQSVGGPTGLITLPSAFSAAPRSGGIVGSFAQDDRLGVTSNTISFGGVYGFTDRVEGGFFFNRRYNRAVNSNNGGGFMKFVLSPESHNEPAFAIGAAAGAGDSSPLSAYAVFSRTVSRPEAKQPISFHLGLEYQSLRNFPVNPRSASSSIRPFGGLDLGIAASTSIIVEMRWRHQFETKTLFSAGLAHGFGKTFRVTAGVTNSGFSEGIRPIVQAGFQFALPKGS